MNRTKIDWCDYTWNPVTGCVRGCQYCYARKIYNRFNRSKFNEIIFHSVRLHDPFQVKKPSKIFVGSMSDIEYWEDKWVADVLDICKIANWHIYMFLSKSINAYIGRCFPTDNVMRGITVTKIDTSMERSTVDIVRTMRNSFLSIEPILGPVKIKIPNTIKLIIVGAMTNCGKNNVIPKKEWIQSIRDNVPEEKIHWKENIKRYL